MRPEGCCCSSHPLGAAEGGASPGAVAAHPGATEQERTVRRDARTSTERRVTPAEYACFPLSPATTTPVRGRSGSGT